MLRNHLRKLNFWIVLTLDIILLIITHWLAYMIRFDGELGPNEWSNIRLVLPLLIPLKITVFIFFGLYRGMWRYTSLVDLLNILKACAIISLVAISCLLMVNRFEGFSRAVFVLDGLLTLIAVSGHRVVLRLYYSHFQDFPLIRRARRLTSRRKKLLIIGAGDAAEQIVREVLVNRMLPYHIVGLLDDHPSKIGQRIHGVSVIGPIAELHDWVDAHQPDEILIAIPSASRDQMERIVEVCRTCNISFKTLPSLGEIINDKVSIKSIRDVSYKDLLGRPPVRLELDMIEKTLENQVILVTGAGGSIGAELCRQILRFRPRQLILFDASEHNLYQVEMEILYEIGFTNYISVLGYLQEKGLIDEVIQRYKPDLVFHAAAYKHVPIVETNPWEAVKNNIIATRRIIEASVKHDVGRFILVSTDKAVRPTNVMGASKRMTEKIMQAYCHEMKKNSVGKPSTRFMAVRFGNVLGSSGSVIPLFKRQIELGGPVTVTDPDMTRYFMSIEEAAQLILQAVTMGEGGEIFILEMGTPVRIAQMARDLIRLCGKEPDLEIEIKYIGLRPGEKLHEELITEGEGIVPTNHEKIMVLRGNGCDLESLAEPLSRLEQFAREHNAIAIKSVLREMIPEYTPMDDLAVL
ncbi:MAG: polysaccharide biosynthesis protein [Proteobacteria bacterium]|nr:polysaccharide biosynthesis protein [Pseudomonadota bacterium]MBU1686559.1 polysaccharide biosynthesis protein [Pseudomonadota bacterium]